MVSKIGAKEENIMKKIIAFSIVLIMFISFTACANGKNNTQEIFGEPEPPDTTFTIDGNIIGISFHEIEEDFISDMSNKYGKNTKFHIYGTDELTAEILEYRIGRDGLVIERSIGMVTNKEGAGDGIIINADKEYYIGYNGVDFPIYHGTIILSYFIYNPDTTYMDDIIDRYDFLLSRECEI